MIILRAQFLKFLSSETKDFFFHPRKSAFREAPCSFVDQIFSDVSIEKQVGNSAVFSVNSLFSLGVGHLQNCAHSEKILDTSLKA